MEYPPTFCRQRISGASTRFLNSIVRLLTGLPCKFQVAHAHAIEFEFDVFRGLGPALCPILEAEHGRPPQQDPRDELSWEWTSATLIRRLLRSKTSTHVGMAPPDHSEGPGGYETTHVLSNQSQHR